MTTNIKAYINTGPTSLPTFAPTLLPTANPTTVPTFAPTIQTVPIASISSSMTLTGYNTASTSMLKSFFRVMDTPVTLTASQNAAITAIIAFSQNVSVSEVTITSAKQTSTGLTVTTVTNIFLIGYFATFDITSINVFIDTNQKNSVTNSAIFAAILATVQQTYEIPELNTVTGATVTTPTSVIIYPDSNNKKKADDISKGGIAAAVIMSIFGFTLVVAAIWYYATYIATTDISTNYQTTQHVENEKEKSLELADVGTTSI